MHLAKEAVTEFLCFIFCGFLFPERVPDKLKGETHVLNCRYKSTKRMKKAQNREIPRLIKELQVLA